jgi:hypothetical protein
MTLSGYSLPRTPEGRASIVPHPPWHYVGDFLLVEYWADTDAVRAVPPSRRCTAKRSATRTTTPRPTRAG